MSFDRQLVYDAQITCNICGCKTVGLDADDLMIAHFLWNHPEEMAVAIDECNLTEARQIE